MSSSFEFSGSFCSGIMKYICSICRMLGISLIQVTQVTRPWGCICHPETSKLHTGNAGAIFPVLEYSRSMSELFHAYLSHDNSQLFNAYLSHGGTLLPRAGGSIEFTMLLHGCKLQTEVQSAEELNRLRSHSSHSRSLGQWMSHCCFAPEEYCMLHLLHGQSLSLLHTVLQVNLHVHCKHTHTSFRFLDFTIVGNFLKVTLKLTFCLIMISNTVDRPGLWICLLTSEPSLR